MKILVLGAGAVGGYFGGRLVQAGADVTFLVRPERKQRLDASGLHIESGLGNFDSPVKTVTASDLREPADVVLLTCKAYDLDSAIEATRPAVGSATAVLPLLNGIRHIDRLNAEFGTNRVLGGVAKIVSALAPDGTILHSNDWCSITFGEQSGEMSPRLLELESAFPSDSVTAKAVPDINQRMWEKIVHLCTAAGICCLMRATIGVIASVPGGTELLLRFLDSNAEIASREGFAPSETFLDEYRKLFHNKTVTYMPSMLRDIERNNPTEGEHVVGFMRDKARSHGLDDSLHTLICLHLQAHEVRRQAGRA